MRAAVGRLRWGDSSPSQHARTQYNGWMKGFDMKFFDQYKRPEWQKRRLEMLESANWMCQSCHSKENQLHVHHKRYVKDRKVWEYQDNELVVLCDSCHTEAHSDKSELDLVLVALPTEEISGVAALITGYGGAYTSGLSVCNEENQILVEIGRLARACRISNIGIDEIAALTKAVEEKHPSPIWSLL